MASTTLTALRAFTPILTQGRSFCSKPTKRVWSKKETETFKRINFENRLLFGEKLPLTKTAKTTPKAKVSSKPTKSASKTNAKTPLTINTQPLTEPISQANSVNSAETDTRNSSLKDILSYPLLPSPGGSPEEPNLPSVARPPSVSKILSDTMPPESRYFLEKWEQEMIAKLGPDGFAQHKQETFTNGHNFHSCIEKYLSGDEGVDSEVTSANEGHWRSIQSVLPDFTQTLALETPVLHPHLGYKGILDCMAHYKGRLYLCEWKTSKKQKSRLEFTYDNPLQVAAYMGGVNSDQTFTHKVEEGLLVIAYEDGSPAHVHKLNPHHSHHYWKLWLRRLHQYWTQVQEQTTEL